MGSCDKRPRREDPAANGTALTKVFDKWRNTASLDDTTISEKIAQARCGAVAEKDTDPWTD